MASGLAECEKSALESLFIDRYDIDSVLGVPLRFLGQLEDADSSCEEQR